MTVDVLRGQIDIGLLLVLIGFGAMSIAAWLYVRFPSRGPNDLRSGFIHLAAAMLVAKLLVPSASTISGSGDRLHALVSVFAIQFPTLVYLLLVGLWILRLVQRTLSMGR